MICRKTIWLSSPLTHWNMCAQGYWILRECLYTYTQYRKWSSYYQIQFVLCKTLDRAKKNNTSLLDTNPQSTPIAQHDSKPFLSTIQSLLRWVNKYCQAWASPYQSSTDWRAVSKIQIYGWLRIQKTLYNQTQRDRGREGVREGGRLDRLSGGEGEKDLLYH